MKKMMKLFTIMMTAVMILCNSMPVKAEGYEYTVTLYSGDVATFAKGSKTLQETVEAGGNVAFIDFDYHIEDPKYYLKGFRITGSDTSDQKYLTLNEVSEDRFSVSLMNITGDMDLVLVYGVESTKITYQVVYLDQDTKEPIAAASTFTGSAGDKPIASAIYVEGYEPVFDLATKTLSEGKDNTITFYYTKREPVINESITTETETEIITNRIPGSVITEPTDKTVPISDVVTPEGNVKPEGGVIVDENETPTGNQDLIEGEDPVIEPGENPTPTTGFSKFGGTALALGSGIALILLFFLFFKRKKSEN